MINYHLTEWPPWLYANSKWGRALGDDGTGSIGTLELLPMELATAPRKNILHRQQWKISKALSLGFQYPHLSLYYKKNPSSKWHTHPSVYCRATSNSQDRPKKRSIERLNLKEMWYIYTLGSYSGMKNRHEIMPLIQTKLDVRGSYV